MIGQTRSGTGLLRSALLMGSVLAMGSLISCWSKPRLSVTGGEKPTFHLSRGEALIDFAIMGPRQRPGSGRNGFIVWQFRPIDTSSEAELVRLPGDIQYGVVPAGCKQIYPENDAPPPAIQAAELYLIQMDTFSAPHAQLEFELRDGKIIELPIK